MAVEKFIEMKNQIEGLSKIEKIEVFKIIKNYDVFYTQNKNGIFLILNKLAPKIIKELENFLVFLDETKQILE
tara:strand:- start:956 stop:1174 length:219 start_codon:yes stop_codon:yes gene_type:complete